MLHLERSGMIDWDPGFISNVTGTYGTYGTHVTNCKN
jgi:hypothetical protein